MTLKLCQVIAIEKGVKSRVYGEITNMHKACQKPALFEGHTRVYEPKTEEDQPQAPEKNKVQMSTNEMLKKTQEKLAELFDITATKDYANTQAVADVVVDGKVLVKAAPPTFLLFLEKQLADLHKFVATMPTLDPAMDWNLDENQGLYKTNVVKTLRTRKVTKPLVLYPHSEHHPAQTDKITEDIVAGEWNQVRQSGALPKPKKEAFLEKIQNLSKAVKVAREEANSMEIEQKQEPGQGILGWLLS
jgi:hypothetical protein